MNGALSPECAGSALGGCGLVAGLASGHAELAVLGTPFSCSSGWASCSPTSRT